MAIFGKLCKGSGAINMLYFGLVAGERYYPMPYLLSKMGMASFFGAGVTPLKHTFL